MRRFEIISPKISQENKILSEFIEVELRFGPKRIPTTNVCKHWRYNITQTWQLCDPSFAGDSAYITTRLALPTVVYCWRWLLLQLLRWWAVSGDCGAAVAGNGTWNNSLTRASDNRVSWVCSTRTCLANCLIRRTRQFLSRLIEWFFCLCFISQRGTFSMTINLTNCQSVSSRRHFKTVYALSLYGYFYSGLTSMSKLEIIRIIFRSNLIYRSKICNFFKNIGLILS